MTRNMGSLLVDHCFLSNPLVTQIILQGMLEEHATCYRVDCLLVHLFDVLDVRTQWDLVSGQNTAHERNQAQVTHLFDSFCHFAVRGGFQTRLVSIQQLARFVHEFEHHRRVVPVNVFLVERAHVALANLAAGHGPIEEGGRALHLEIELPVHLLHYVALREVALVADERSIVSVLLFVLPGGGERIISVFELEVGLRVRQGVIDAHILAQGLLDDTVRREVLVRVDQHLTGCPVFLDQLEEGIVAKRDALISIVEENLVPCQSCILELLQPLIDLVMNL